MEEIKTNIEELIQTVYSQARLLGACPVFTGRERTLAEIADVFLSPKGVEFCFTNRFPNLATLRLFKPFAPERLGVYLDAGNITLRNPKRVLLAGHTAATINCDTLARHEILVFQGASAVVNACGWSVVAVKAVNPSRVVKNISGHAIAL